MYSTTLFRVEKNARKTALQLFNRTEETALEDVNIIKEWMKTQPHLPEIMSDVQIKNFLLLNKHSIEKTKQKIDMYYTIRSLIPDMFDESNPKLENMKEFMDNSYCCIHPIPVEGMYRVYFLKAKEPNKFSPRELGMQCHNIAEVRLYEDCMIGEIIIFDMSTLTLTDLTKVTPTLMTKLVNMYAKVFSQRVKSAYVINSPVFVTVLMTLLKSIVKPKIFDRIKVCENADILSEVFTRNMLPKDYGGEGPSLEELNEMMKIKLAEYQDRFDLLDKMRVDEHLRPRQLNNDAVLGFYGNFKKLNVD